MKNILKSILFFVIMNFIFLIFYQKNALIFSIISFLLITYFYRKKGLTYIFFNNCTKNFSVKFIIPLILISFSFSLFIWFSLCLIYAHYPHLFSENETTIEVFRTLIFAPILEEVVFRYIMFSELIKKYNIYIALLISSTLFAIIHDGITVIFSAFICGLILGIVFYTTKSILSSIIIHSTLNLIACLEDLKIINIEFIYNFMINNYIYTILAIITAILCIIFCLGHLNKYKIN